MTTATAVEVEHRKRGARRQPRTVAELAYRLFSAAAEASGNATREHRWPSARYRADPVAFFREVLGVEPWSKQIEVIEAIRDHKRVAIKSGHKVSKSHTAAGVALWFHGSFDDARVVMTSTTSRQVDQILWRELKMMHARAGRCVACKEADRERAARRETPGPRPCPHSVLIDGDPRELARTGLKSADFREIVGFTARESEAVAGVSGANLLYLVDEASGVPDAIFEAIEGNRAGGARIAMFSNPTRTEGEFYAAFDAKAALYKTLTISSADTPNVREGRVVIPGLATREWVEEKKIEWGEDSALYKIRVEGKFVLREDGKILSVHAISESEKLWPDAVGEGRLCIGLDPAGPGLAGDETAFAARRGQKVTALFALLGQTEDAILAHLLGFLKEHRMAREDELPLVIVDKGGPIGIAIYGRLRAYADANPHAFALLGVDASERASREPALYERARDELWANLARWVKEGGALIPDVKLAKELHTPQWIGQLSGKLKVTPKDEIRKAIGRSPDRADAVALAVWGPAVQLDMVGTTSTQAEEFDRPALDPYAALSTWGSR